MLEIQVNSERLSQRLGLNPLSNGIVTIISPVTWSVTMPDKQVAPFMNAFWPIRTVSFDRRLPATLLEQTLAPDLELGLHFCRLALAKAPPLHYRRAEKEISF